MVLMSMIKMVDLISTQLNASILLWQISILGILIFIVFFIIKVLLFMKKASLYIDLKVAFIEHLLEEISS